MRHRHRDKNFAKLDFEPPLKCLPRLDITDHPQVTYYPLKIAES